MMKTFIINIGGEGDETEYLDEIQGEDFADVVDKIREMAEEKGETLYVCEEGTDRWEEVEA